MCWHRFRFHPDGSFLVWGGLVIGLLLLAIAGPPAALAGWEYGDWALIQDPDQDGEGVSVAPDGQGGMLVAIRDPGLPAGKVRVSRIDHVGAELWGEGGTIIPWPYGATDQTTPVEVACDAAGGAYCVTCEVWGAANYLVVTHLTPVGAFDWKCYVADMGAPAGYTPLHAEIAQSEDGEMIVGWTHAVLGAFSVQLARIGHAGSVDWSCGVLPGLQVDPYQSYWHMIADGMGGVFVNYLYQPAGQGLAWRVQHVSSAGAALFGPDGHQLQGWLDARCAMASDGGGGVYLAARDTGNHQAAAQHLDAYGNETWAWAGVAALPYEGDPFVCADGHNGAVLALSCNQDIYAQHLDIYGNLLWGSSGVVAASLPGSQVLTSLVNDGFNGAILGYVDYYYASGGQNRVPSGVRLGWFGEKIWEGVGLWLSGFNDGLETYAVEAVADGSGGALFAWNEQSQPIGVDAVYGVGINAQGEAPNPVVTCVWPDAAEPGAAMPVLIYGDYLEAGDEFALSQGGSAIVPVTGNVFLGYQLIAGNLDLGSAAPGAYDCLVSVDGVPLSVLPNAFGIGSPPSCPGDGPMEVTTYPPADWSESLRQAAFDPRGDVHAVWVEYGDFEYWLRYAVGSGDGWGGSPQLLFHSVNEIAEPCVVVDGEGWTHVAFVLRHPTDPELCHIRIDPEGLNHYQAFLGNGQPKANPTVAATDDGRVHFVYEEGPAGSSALFYTWSVESSFAEPVDLNAGQNAAFPDLTGHDGDGLILAFSRDLWLPGFREMCYQRYPVGGPWEAPVSIHWGNFVHSPSVAWDRRHRVLFSWIVENTGGDGLLHTCLMEDGVLGPVRWRLGTEPRAMRAAVSAAAPGKFYLFTEECPEWLPVVMNLRSGDGNVFYPRQRLNSYDAVDMPAFAAQYGGEGLFAFWQNNETAATPLYQWGCLGGGTQSIPADEPLPYLVGPEAHPNPFRPRTTITFSTPKAERLDLAVFDVTGRKIRTLLCGPTEPGVNSIVWDGRDDAGRELASGTYLVRLQCGDQCQARRLVLTK